MRKGKFKRGERRVSMNSLYCKYRIKGETADFCKEEIHRVNSTCEEKLSSKELETNCQNAESYFQSEIKPTMQTQPEQKEEKEKPEVWRDILSARDRYAKIEGTSKLLIEKNRVFKEGGDEFVDKVLDAEVSSEGTFFWLEVRKKLGARFNAPRDDFDENKLILNCKNCFVNLETGKIEADNSQKSLMQIDTDFRPELGESKLFVDALKFACPDGYKMILEFAACSLSRGLINPEKAIIFCGNSNNGKSTTLITIENILGDNNYSTVRLQELQTNRFKASRLENKFANICQDLPPTELKEFDLLKPIISHEPIDVEEKNVKGWTTTITAIMMYSCNELPTLPNYGDSILKRLSVAVFSKSFTKDDLFKKSLSAPEERSRILNTLIAYHKRILDNKGKLLHVQDLRETEKIWKSHTDSATQFIAKHILPLGEGAAATEEEDMIVKPSLEQVHDDYLRFCTITNQTSLLINRFNTSMEKEGYKRYNTREKNVLVKKWSNVILRRIENRVVEQPKGLVDHQ